MEKLQNYIGGQLVPPQSGAYIDNYDPGRGQVYSLIPDSDASDVQAAVDAAKEAFPGWSSTSIQERSRIMVRISELIGENLDRLAAAESKDNGKPVSLATAVDIPRAQANFYFYATAILHDSSESHSMGEVALN